MNFQIDYKKEYMDFHMFEIPQLCEYFHDMASKGWMLVRLRLHTATFKRCEPQDISFYIDINKRSTSLGYDYVSIEDERFSDFVQDFGLEPVCRYSFYQIFCTDQKLEFDFYEGGVEAYLQSKKKQILRFESAYYVTFVVMYSILAILWFIPTHTDANFNLYQRYFMAPIIFCFAYPNCIPLLRWLLKKEKYQASLAKIKARSNFSICLYSIIFIPLILAILTGEAVEFLILSFTLVYTLIPFFLFRAIFIEKHSFIRWVITLICFVSVIYFSITCLWIPYHVIQVEDVVAPYLAYDQPNTLKTDFYIDNKSSNIFVDEYSFNEKRAIDQVCYNENKYRESSSFDVNAYCNQDGNYTLYVIKNSKFQDSLIASILAKRNAYRVHREDEYQVYQYADYLSYIVKDNFVLSVNEINLTPARIEALFVQFHI